MSIQPELIASCINGERKAEYQLYKLTFSYLMSICIRYTRNEDKAKEVLNQGFYKVLVNLKHYKTDSPFKPWIRKIMINTLINEFNKEQAHHRNIQYVEDYFETENYSELNACLSRADTEEIYSFIARLAPASRQVFNLYYIDGYKHKEIAEMMNISEGTSKWHLNAAREKLKELLKKNELTLNIKSNA
ncbi:MAG TPA: RNA polymerase sigma factor [Bacteroidia bacterium]|nr:RNA polymerase sigma factor [Bacteroidia bacterium]